MRTFLSPLIFNCNTSFEAALLDLPNVLCLQAFSTLFNVACIFAHTTYVTCLHVTDSVPRVLMQPSNITQGKPDAVM